jgi:hypothetical protein
LTTLLLRLDAALVPITPNIQYGIAERNFLEIWLGVAISLGLLLPAIAWLLWRNHLLYRKILGFYLLLLAIQIVTEQVFSSIGFPSLVVLIGTLYTVFRIWQIWQGLQLIEAAARNSRMSILLWLLEVFWVGNIVFLLTVGWPSILT